MIDLSRVKYKLIGIIEDGTQIDLTGTVQQLYWEEGEKELSMRLSCTLINRLYDTDYVSNQIKPNCILIVLVDTGVVTIEVARGKIVDWEISSSNSEDTLKLTCYDALYDLKESNDHRYISAGTSTKTALMSIFDDWGVPIEEYNGPDISHAKTVFKNDALSDIILDLLDAAKKQGAGEYVVRAVKNKVSIIPKGSNKEIYHLDESLHAESLKQKFSVAGMVTRIKVLATATGSEDRQAIEAIVDGMTEYGIRQKIHVRSSEDTLDAAKTAAQEILDEDGIPEQVITWEGPDIPFIRKGDKIHMKTRIHNGFFYVDAVRHNADDKTMTLTIDANPIV